MTSSLLRHDETDCCFGMESIVFCDEPAYLGVENCSSMTHLRKTDVCHFMGDESRPIRSMRPGPLRLAENPRRGYADDAFVAAFNVGVGSISVASNMLRAIVHSPLGTARAIPCPSDSRCSHSTDDPLHLSRDASEFTHGHKSVRFLRLRHRFIAPSHTVSIRRRSALYDRLRMRFEMVYDVSHDASHSSRTSRRSPARASRNALHRRNAPTSWHHRVPYSLHG